MLFLTLSLSKGNNRCIEIEIAGAIKSLMNKTIRLLLEHRHIEETIPASHVGLQKYNVYRLTHYSTFRSRALARRKRNRYYANRGELACERFVDLPLFIINYLTGAFCKHAYCKVQLNSHRPIKIAKLLVSIRGSSMSKYMIVLLGPTLRPMVMSPLSSEYAWSRL